jgi:two-component system response regulator HupR/HoxA
MIAILPTILVIDDEVRSQEALRRTLEEEFTVFTASGAQDGRAIMEREPVQVVLCDHRMPGVTGINFLIEVRERWPDAVRMIISGYTDVEDIIAGINVAGIYQYILKPWHPESLLLNVRAAAQLYDLQQQSNRMNVELRTMQPVLQRRVATKHEKLREHYEFSRIIRATDSPLNEVIEQAARVATCDIAVHISGESGSGKELLGRAIHYSSPRATRAFVIENCGAMSDQLLESELFGHKRGSLPAPTRIGSACSSRPMAVPFSWTRSAIPRLRSRSSCCACCRRARYARWAVRVRARSTCACCLRPTVTWKRK